MHNGRMSIKAVMKPVTGGIPPEMEMNRSNKPRKVAITDNTKRNL